MLLAATGYCCGQPLVMTYDTAVNDPVRATGDVFAREQSPLHVAAKVLSAILTRKRVIGSAWLLELHVKTPPDYTTFQCRPSLKQIVPGDMSQI